MKIAAALSLVRQNARPVLILAAALVLPACASMKAKGAKSAKGTNGKLFAVSSSTASFYRYGPQQGNGPDESLPKDTLMTLIRPSFGYCKVQLVGNSKEGYVASEDIKPATPTLIASLNPPAPVSTTSARENFDVRTFEPPPSDTLARAGSSASRAGSVAAVTQLRASRLVDHSLGKRPCGGAAGFL